MSKSERSKEKRNFMFGQNRGQNPETGTFVINKLFLTYITHVVQNFIRV